MLERGYQQKLTCKGEAGVDNAITEYSGLLYTWMLQDKVRNRAYEASIRLFCQNRDCVVDLGTGAFAIWARKAKECGARRVIGIEVNRGAAARARSYEKDGIEIVEKPIESITPLDAPLNVDVIIQEIVGCIASSEGMCYLVHQAQRCMGDVNTIHIPWKSETYFVPAMIDRTSNNISEDAHFMKWFNFPRSTFVSECQTFESFIFPLSEMDMTQNRQSLFKCDGKSFNAFVFWHTTWTDPNHRFDTLNEVTNWPVFIVLLPATVVGVQLVGVRTLVDVTALFPRYELKIPESNVYVQWSGCL